VFHWLFICANFVLAGEDPFPICIDTGPRCHSTCDGLVPGNYQWCGACGWFIQCVGTTLFFQKCPANLIWHDLYSACLSASATCTECVVYGPTTTVDPLATTTPALGMLLLRFVLYIPFIFKIKKCLKITIYE